MGPLSSSSEQEDFLFKSAEENPYYKDFVAKLIDQEEEESSSISEDPDFVPYYQFWNMPIQKLEEKDK